MLFACVFVLSLGLGLRTLAVDVDWSCSPATSEVLTHVQAESLLSVHHHRRRQNRNGALPEFARTAEAPPTSVDPLLGGYNIYYGYPLTNSESDQGFSKHAGAQVFQAKYAHTEVLIERRAAVPDGFTEVPDALPDCSVVSNVTSTYRSHDLAQWLKAFVVADVGGESQGWFRASDEFKTFENMRQKNLVNVIGTSVCTVANLSVNHLNWPPPSEDFLRRVRTLPDAYDATHYFNFLDEFGTHVVTSAAMGAMFGVSGFFNASSYAHINTSNTSWSELVQTHALSFGEHRHMLTGKVPHVHQTSSFFAYAAQEGRIARGVAPSDHDATSWAELAAINPAPVRLQLASICKIMGNVSKRKQANCEVASAPDEYCMLRVMPREGLDPRICLEELPDASCLWDSDCGGGDICRKGACAVASLETRTDSREGSDTNKDALDNTVGINGGFQLSASIRLNMLVVLPMCIVAIPLGYAWGQLLKLAHSDEVWTAQDADLREVDISQIGASGVVLLRTPSDRKLAILLSFAGIMLQTMFLYFMSIYSWMNIGGKKVTHDAPCVLLFGSIFMNTITCCSSMITGMKAWTTTAPKGYEEIHHILVGLDSFIIPSCSLLVGIVFLCTSSSIASLVLSSTAMAFVCSINSKLAAMMSWSLSAHGGRIYQPAKLGIKDAVNSMEYTYMSLVFAATVSLIMVPVGVFVFRV